MGSSSVGEWFSPVRNSIGDDRAKPSLATPLECATGRRGVRLNGSPGPHRRRGPDLNEAEERRRRCRQRQRRSSDQQVDVQLALANGRAEGAPEGTVGRDPARPAGPCARLQCPCRARRPALGVRLDARGGRRHRRRVADGGRTVGPGRLPRGARRSWRYGQRFPDRQSRGIASTILANWPGPHSSSLGTGSGWSSEICAWTGAPARGRSCSRSRSGGGTGPGRGRPARRHEWPGRARA